MRHKECSGRVLIDRTHSSDTRLELYCLRCGKTWDDISIKNPLGRWLLAKEYGYMSKVTNGG